MYVRIYIYNFRFYVFIYVFFGLYKCMYSHHKSILFHIFRTGTFHIYLVRVHLAVGSRPSVPSLGFRVFRVQGVVQGMQGQHHRP